MSNKTIFPVFNLFSLSGLCFICYTITGEVYFRNMAIFWALLALFNLLV